MHALLLTQPEPHTPKTLGQQPEPQLNPISPQTLLVSNPISPQTLLVSNCQTLHPSLGPELGGPVCPRTLAPRGSTYRMMAWYKAAYQHACNTKNNIIYKKCNTTGNQLDTGPRQAGR